MSETCAQSVRHLLSMRHLLSETLDEVKQLLSEKLIYTRIYDFLVAKNVLYEKQFGFRRNHSTSHAINYSIKYIADKIEQKSMLLESS